MLQLSWCDIAPITVYVIRTQSKFYSLHLRNIFVKSHLDTENSGMGDLKHKYRNWLKTFLSYPLLFLDDDFIFLIITVYFVYLFRYISPDSIVYLFMNITSVWLFFKSMNLFWNKIALQYTLLNSVVPCCHNMLKPDCLCPVDVPWDGTTVLCAKLPSEAYMRQYTKPLMLKIVAFGAKPSYYLSRCSIILIGHSRWHLNNIQKLSYKTINLKMSTLKRKYRLFDELFTSGCHELCQNDHVGTANDDNFVKMTNFSGFFFFLTRHDLTLGWFQKSKNIERHKAHIIVSWPNPKQRMIVHTSDLMMIIRQSIYSLNHHNGNG